MKPIIGITPTPAEETFNHGTFRRYAIASNYTEAVEAAGGVPLVLPLQHGNVDQILSLIDGLLVSGGGDIRPDRYGDDTVHPTTYGIDDLRDEFEIALVRGAIARGTPIFGICRGIQVLNVALGGTLIQDVADQHGTEVQHRQQENQVPNSEPGHEVRVEPGSLLHEIYGADVLAVNSFHHQALRTVAPELRVIGRAPDGIVEAVERPGSPWVLAVQWHPEMMFRAHPEHLRPFQAFVQVALRRRSEATLRVS